MEKESRVRRIIREERERESNKSNVEGLVMKPCPFCGSDGEVRREENRIEIVCKGVGCYAKRVCMTGSKKVAIAKWNERAL